MVNFITAMIRVHYWSQPDYMDFNQNMGYIQWNTAWKEPAICIVVANVGMYNLYKSSAFSMFSHTYYGNITNCTWRYLTFYLETSRKLPHVHLRKCTKRPEHILKTSQTSPEKWDPRKFLSFQTSCTLRKNILDAFREWQENLSTS